MDLFASSVLRTPCVLAVAGLLAVAGCVSEKGHGPDAGAPVRLHEPGGVQTAGAGGAGVSGAGTGGATAGDGGLGDGGDPDGSTLDPDAQVDGGGPTCDSGFILDGGRCLRDSCEASDDEPGACGDHGSCTDGTGEKPTCDCDEGYVLEDLQCVRNPCIPLEHDPSPCDRNASCTYEGEGDASCECDAGYDGDGESCERNACVQLDDEDPPCSDNEECTPTGDGTRSCECEEGFDDCDDDGDNGCEAELAVDEDHCGVCGLECADGLECVAGECAKRVIQMALGFSAAFSIRPDHVVLGAGGGGSILRGHAASHVPVVLQDDADHDLLRSATRVAVNSSHACLVRANEMGIECWGSNANHQLGSSGTDDTYADFALASVKAIAAGAAHSCVVAADGRVFCWGRGDLGQLGNGIAQSGGSRTYDETFAGAGYSALNVTNAIDVQAGNNMSCALTESGNVYCWGSVSPNIYAPELVRDADGIALTDALMMCTGANHGCALQSDGTVVCWGDDSQNQLGSTVNPSGRSRWVLVPLTDVSAVACGANHTCALLESGEVTCWGQNSSGQLGSGDAAPNTTPVTAILPDETRARAVYAGSGAVGTCFELTTGQVYCAGYNYYGQLGNGTSGAQQTTTPVEITSWP